MDPIFSHRSGAQLWQGGMHDVDRLLRHGNGRIHVIGLFAQEYQPDDPSGRYELIKLGYDDNDQAGDVELSSIANLADSASDMLSDRLRAGRSCLSSCAAGLNRSGLVSAMTLMKLTGMTPTEAVAHVRRMRHAQEGNQALCNPRFVEIVHDLAGRAGSKATFTEWVSAHR